jgi:hypothetical protein
VAQGVLLEADAAAQTPASAAVPAEFQRIPRVEEIDRVHVALCERQREIDEHGAELAFVLQRGRAEEDFVDVEARVQIDLNARGLFQHAEADRVLPADELLRWIDANIEMVVEQVVVGAVRSVGTEEDVRLRRYTRPLRMSCRRLFRRAGRRRLRSGLRRHRQRDAQQSGKGGELRLGASWSAHRYVRFYYLSEIPLAQ